MNKTKAMRRDMEAVALHPGAPTAHWEDNTSCIYVVEFKRVVGFGNVTKYILHWYDS